MNGMVFKAAIFKCQITQRKIAKILECHPSYSRSMQMSRLKND